MQILNYLFFSLNADFDQGLGWSLKLYISKRLLKKKKNTLLFKFKICFCLCWVLVVAPRIFHLFFCRMWDLVLGPGIESEPLALGTRNPSHWNPREVPDSTFQTSFSD